MRCQREWAMVKRIQETRLAPKAAPLSHPIVALLESSYGTVSQGRTEEGALFYQVVPGRVLREPVPELAPCHIEGTCP